MVPRPIVQTRITDGPLLTPREFAARMGISYPTVKQWLYRGKLRAIKTPGGHYRIPAEEVARQLQPHSSKPKKQSSFRAHISGRNQLVGRIEQITIDGLLAQVKLALGDQHINAIITAEAAREMDLRSGQRAAALIKSTEVMIVKE